MNRSAVEHHVLLPYVQPLARNLVRFRLMAASGDIAACRLVCWKRYEPHTRRELAMSRRYDDGLRTEWLLDVDFPEEAHYIKYYFQLRDQGGETLCFSDGGFSAAEPETGLFELLQADESEICAVPEWAKGCVYYQIFPERFAVGRPEKTLRAYEPWEAQPTKTNFLGGDLRGVSQRLPYLASLGVECLYFNPVFAADFNHKYATADYFHVDPDLGSDDDLAELVEAAHRLNIRVVLDGVFNHVGVHFPPFADLMENGENSRYRDWFYPKRYPIERNPDCYECVGDYEYMPRLRVRNPEVREYVLSVLLYWLDKAHIDGWRFDVADELDAGAARYWRDGVKTRYPDALMLAETWGDAGRLVCGNDRFDCAMNYLFRDAAMDYFARSAIDEQTFDRRVQSMLMRYPDQVSHAMYNCLGSHDTPRLLTECGGDEQRARLAMAFQMLFVGSPAVYYGDEVGMAGENDPGCRGGMRWDRAECDLRRYVAELIALRKDHPCLRRGGYRTLARDVSRRVFAMERYDDWESVRGVFNLGDAPQTLDFADGTEPVTVSPMSVEIVHIKRR